MKLGKNIEIKKTEFNGKNYIDIRKMYEKDGEMKPTRKGILFSVDDWDYLVKNIGDIDLEVKG